MKRRSILSGVSAAALLLAGCGGSLDKTLQQVVTDTNILATGLNGMLAQLATVSIPGLTPDVVAKIGTSVASIQQVAAAVGAVSTVAAAQPLIQKIETYLNTIVGVLATLPLPPPISTVLQAATILLPVIEIAVGLVVSNLPTAAHVRFVGGMSVDQARLVLRGTAARAP